MSDSFIKQSLKNLMKPKTILVGLFLLLCIISVLPNLVNFLNWAEFSSLSFRQSMIRDDRTSEKTGIVVVGIDDKTISDPDVQSMFGRFPYPRDFYAYTLSFINRTKPKKVLIDTAFTLGKDKVNPEKDRALVDAINQSKAPVITGFDIQTQSHHQIDSKEQAFLLHHSIAITGKPIIDTLQKQPFPVLPYPLMKQSRSEFGVAFGAWSDNLSRTVRRWIPFILMGPKQTPVPHFALRLAMESPHDVITVDGNQTLTIGNHRTVHLGGDHFPTIRWHGDASLTAEELQQRTETGSRYLQSDWSQMLNIKPVPTVYTVVSISDILRAEAYWRCSKKKSTQDEPLCQHFHSQAYYKPLSPTIFSNRYVLIGETTHHITTPDRHQTPFNGRYSGTLILANILDNLLHDNFVQLPQSPLLVFLLSIIGVCGLILTIVLRYGLSTLGITIPIVVLITYSVVVFAGYHYWNLWLNWAYPVSFGMITFVSSYYILYVRAEAQKKKLRFTFQRYVAKPVMDYIEKNPEAVQLGGHKRELTMLFCDIRGFTTFSEENSSDEVQAILTRYFTVMNHIIQDEYRGTLNKLIGDAIMAYWGFPLEEEDAAYLAVSAALVMKRAIIEWRHEPENPSIYIGIGINTGEVTIGNVGSEEFMDFTVIGDNVNLASRLESLNKEYHTTIIISQSTYEKVKDRINAIPLGSVTVRGKAHPVDIYEPIGWIDPNDENTLTFAENTATKIRV